MKLLTVIAAAFIAIFALSMPARAQSTLRVVILGEPDTLDPEVNSTTYASDVDRQIFTALTGFQPDGTLGPAAAKSWAVSPDGLTYRFSLRTDLSWSDGKKLTADDWVYSFRRLLNPKTLAEEATMFYGILGAQGVNLGNAPPETLSVKAIDDATIEIRLASPNPNFPSLLAVFFPVPRQAIEAHGAAWLSPQFFVGNGPFVLAAYSPHTRIELARNPRMPPDLAPHFDKVAIDIVTDQATSLERYRAREADLVAGLWPIEFNRVPAAMAGDRHVFPAGITMYLPLNAKRPPLDDIRVRKALSLAVDREVIASKIVGAGATPTNLIVPGAWTGLPTQHAQADLLKPIEARRALAKSLLASAGYSDSKRPQVEIIYAGTMRQRIAIALQAMWRAIGVDAKLRQSEVTAMYASLDGGDYSVGVAQFLMDPIKDPGYLLSIFLHGGMGDYNRVPSPAYEAALAAASREGDAAKRASMMADAEGILLANWDLVPLYLEPNRYLIAPGIGGWQSAAAPLYWRYLLPLVPAH